MSFRYGSRLFAGLACAIALVAFGAACSGTGGGNALPNASVPTGNSAVAKLPDAVPAAPCDPQADSVGKGRVETMDVGSGDCDNSCGTQGTCVECPDGSYADVCASAGGDGNGSGGGAGGGNCGPATESVGIRTPQTTGSAPGGGCGVTPPAGGDPGPIALRTPEPGGQCWGSPGSLGDQIPVNLADAGHEITDIIAITADNINGVPDVYGWEYITADGIYLQQNLSFTSFWQAFGDSLPAVGPAISAGNAGGIVPINSTIGDQIKSSLPGHDAREGSCFNNPLPTTAES